MREAIGNSDSSCFASDATFDWRLRRWLSGFQSFQRRARRFVVGALGDEFAAEGFGEGGGGQTLHRFPRGGEAGFDPVGEGEEVFDAADDFFALLRSRLGNLYLSKICLG